MKYPGFVGGTYSGRSLTPAGDRCINLYPESMKGSGDPENDYVLLSTPGCSVFTTVPTSPIQAMYTEPATGILYVIAAGWIYSVRSDGSFLGVTGQSAALPAGPYSMASNGTQLMIVCANVGQGFIVDLKFNTYHPITSGGYLNAYSVRCIDNYFITRVFGGTQNQFQISAIADGLTWDALDIGDAEGGPGPLVADMADHRELWLFGKNRVEIFTNTGNALFPFERINSVFIQEGCAATASVVQLDNTIYWLGRNEQGWARVYKANGYSPVGVSTRAVEYFINQYANTLVGFGISDAVAYGYQDESGHAFYVISFPSATSDPSTGESIKGATWVYDVSEGQWHERQYLDQSSGKNSMTVGLYHGFAYGLHLVGGGDTSGRVYRLQTGVYTENGQAMNRIRRAPHIVDELKRIAYSRFRLSAQVGSGSNADPNNSVSLRVSNDGGITWGNPATRTLGDTGQYQTIIQWNALGSSTRRAFEVSTKVNAPVCFVDAFLDVKEGR